MIEAVPANPARVVVPRAEHPRVSVIVLAWRHEEFLRDCLASIGAAGGHDIPYEVIVVLNGASPAVVRLVEHEVVGAVIVRSRVNLGFAGGCNLARRHAQGELLLLLNDDIEVDPGWMEGLVSTLDDRPDAGAVGSRVVSADGATLLEAGSLLGSDGSPQGVGRGLPESEHPHMSLRTVPYCSGCSLLVRASAWDAAGGLDERYFPAYFEDVDLCLTLDQLGLKTLYQPISRVRHHESASLEETYRNFVFRRSKAAFLQKWATVLPRYPERAYERMGKVVRTQRGLRHLLVIDDQLPNLTSGSGFGRMHDTVTELLRDRWAITVFASNVPGADPRALGGIGVETFEGDLVAHLHDPSVRYDAVIVSRPNNFEIYAGHVRSGQPEAALVYDAEALYHRRFARHLELAENPATRANLQAEYDRYLGFETAIATGADAIVTISEPEADFFRGCHGEAPVFVRSPLSWSRPAGEQGFAARRDIVMVAGWLAGADSPNADGLRWFVRAVLPIIRTEKPWVRLLVTGADPPRTIAALAGPNVTFLGNVASLAELHNEIRVAISPIRFGAGVKLKSAEALEHGVPLVSTTVGAEGLPPEALAVTRVHDDPHDFAEAVIELLDDEARWNDARARIAALREHAPAAPEPWSAILAEARRLRSRVPAGPG